MNTDPWLVRLSWCTWCTWQSIPSTSTRTSKIFSSEQKRTMSEYWTSHLVSGILKDQTTPCPSCLTSLHASTARRLELTGVQGTVRGSLKCFVLLLEGLSKFMMMNSWFSETTAILTWLPHVPRMLSTGRDSKRGSLNYLWKYSWFYKGICKKLRLLEQ